MVRSFSGAPVPDEVLSRILASTPRTPSAGNTDGSALVVLRGPRQTRHLWETTTTEPWRRRAPRWPGLSRAPIAVVVLTSPRRYVDRYSEPDKAASGLGWREEPVPRSTPLPSQEPPPPGREPPLAASPSAPTSDPASSWPVPYWFFDAGQVVMSLLLAAVDSGIGACFLGNFRGEDALLDRLRVPDGWRYVGSVLLGEAGGDDPPSSSLSRPRRSVAGMVHYGGW